MICVVLLKYNWLDEKELLSMPNNPNTFKTLVSVTSVFFRMMEFYNPVRMYLQMKGF